MNGRSCSRRHGPAQFTVVTNFFIWMVWSFSKTFELISGLCFYKHGPVLFTVLNNHFVWMLNHQVYGWAAFPNIPCHGLVHFAALKNRFVLMLCRHSTTFKWTHVRAPPNTVESISRCEEHFRLDEMKLFKNNRTYGWVVLPQTRPSFVHGVEESNCVDVLQPCKNTQVYGWAALPNILFHGPAHFAALKNRFVL